MKFVYDDGGRQESGRKGSARDCVARAIAIAAALPYDDVYRALADVIDASRRLNMSLAAGASDDQLPPRAVDRTVRCRHRLVADGRRNPARRRIVDRLDRRRHRWNRGRMSAFGVVSRGRPLAMTTATDIIKSAPFERPDLFVRSEAHGSGRLYFLQPALTAAQRDEARAVLRKANPHASIQWYDPMTLVCWGNE